jgi:hypothetical protein
VTLYHLWDVLESLDNVLIHRTTLQRDTHIGTGRVAQTLGIDVKTTPHDDFTLNEVLNALMNGSTRHITLCGYILERDARILRQDTEYLFIKIVNLIHFFFRC